MIESLFVYLRGVPSSLLLNVLILTVISCFFVGYILGYFPKAGIFCMGLWIGFVITLTLNNVAFYHIDSNYFESDAVHRNAGAQHRFWDTYTVH